MGKQSYIDFVGELKRRLDQDEAMRLAVGGDFLAVGALQRQLLESLGLKNGDYVVDVGCGSGRLAFQLKTYPHLTYIGLDVVPDLVTYARQLCSRQDWHFETTEGHSIACKDNVADYICFFSVFTHLLHEDTYQYLQESLRVLKPGGRVVFSFLEFRLAAHWPMFNTKSGHLNQFIERDAIYAWARRLGFVVESIHGGDQPHIPLDEEIKWDSGMTMTRYGNLGQSVAVFRKPAQLSETSIAASDTPTLRQRWTIRSSERIVSTRAYIAAGAMNLRLSFVLNDAFDVYAIAHTRLLKSQGYGHLLPNPTLLFFDNNGNAIAHNTGWTTLPEPTKALFHNCLSHVDEHWRPADNDAALWLQLPKGSYSVSVADLHGKDGLVEVDIHLAIPSQLQ